jgi:hypothetical protein
MPVRIRAFVPEIPAELGGDWVSHLSIRKPYGHRSFCFPIPFTGKG